MGLEAGKFFVNLGLSGAEKTASGLAQISDHFDGLKGITVEAKLAILAALAGLEEMTSHSGQFATNMQLAATATGASMHALQLWNNVFQMTTGQSDQGTAVLQKIHDIFFGLQKGQVPDWLGYLLHGGLGTGKRFGQEDVDKWRAHPEAFMSTVMGMSHEKGFKKADLVSMLTEMGLPAGAVEAMVSGKVTPKVMAQAEGPILSDKALNSLSNTFTTFQLAAKHFENAMYLFVDNPIMKELVKGLEVLADKLDGFMKQQHPIDTARALGLTNGTIKLAPVLADVKPMVMPPAIHKILHEAFTSPHQRMIEGTAQRVELTLHLTAKDLSNPNELHKKVMVMFDKHGKAKREHTGSSLSSATGVGN